MVSQFNLTFPFYSFRLLIATHEDYSAALLDSENFVDWDVVDYVLYPSPNQLKCSICLDIPISPRITSCGHIYCLPCIIHYFSYHKQEIASCPVCPQEYFTLEDVRPVLLWETTQYAKGSRVSFRLVHRMKISNIVREVTKERMENVVDNLYKWLPNYGEDDYRYNRLIRANNIDPLYQKDLNTLEKAYEDAVLNQDESATFIYEAIEKVKLKIEDLKTPKARKSHLRSSLPKRNLKKEVDMLIKDCKEENMCFFYMEEEGQTMFLHPLNLKWMMKEMNLSSQSDILLEGVLLDMDECVLTEKHQRRYDFLGHLPISCNYQLALISMDHILKKPENLKGFKEDLRQREALMEKNQAREMRELERRNLEEMRKKRREYVHPFSSVILPEDLSTVPDFLSLESFPSVTNSPKGQEDVESTPPIKNVWAKSPNIKSSKPSKPVDEFPPLGEAPKEPKQLTNRSFIDAVKDNEPPTTTSKGRKKKKYILLV